MATPTADDVFAALRSAPSTSTGWVLAKQFDPSITAGHPQLDRHLLDTLVPERPLLVMESNGHIAYANSEAFRRAGVDRDTADPPTGRYTRDAQGELTGRLEESAALAAFSAGIPFVDDAGMVERISDLLWHAAGKGVTLLHDCGIGAIAGPHDLELLRAAIGADSPVRYRGMLVSTHYDAWMDGGARPGSGDDIFRVDGIKAWSDGSNQAGTGYQREPYLGTESRGSLNYSPEDLAAVVQQAHRDGWQIGGARQRRRGDRRHDRRVRPGDRSRPARRPSPPDRALQRAAPGPDRSDGVVGSLAVVPHRSCPVVGPCVPRPSARSDPSRPLRPVCHCVARRSTDLAAQRLERQLVVAVAVALIKNVLSGH